MTTGNEAEPRDDALAKAWRAHSAEAPPAALDAAILAAAHRAVGSGPRAANAAAAEATRPQRWWMPLAAAATISVVVIGILQVAPQAPDDIAPAERDAVSLRVAPVSPAVAPAKSAAAPAAGEPPSPDVRAAMAPSQPATTPKVALTDTRKQMASSRATPLPAAEPFPADRLSRKSEAEVAPRAGERKDSDSPARAMAHSNDATARESISPSPITGADSAGASGPVGASARPAKTAGRDRESGALRGEMTAPGAPAAAPPELARSPASPAELQARARDPDAWIGRIRKLREDGRVAEAIDEIRDFRRYVADAEARLPADLREWAAR